MRPRERHNPLTDAPEAELLLLCARTTRSEELIGRIRGLIDSGIHWDRFLGWAARHRVLPLVGRTLASLPPGAVPPEILQRLKSRQQDNARRALGLVAELLKLLRLLNAAGIEVIPFKGPVLAMKAYGDIALRQAGDLDLLVHRADMARATALLAAAGLRPFFPTATPEQSKYLESLVLDPSSNYLFSHGEQHLVREDGLVNVDLHWSLTVKDFPLALNVESLWQRLVAMSLAAQPVKTFSPEDTLLVLCINGGKDAWGRLDRVCDVAELVRASPTMDWPAALERATAVGARRMLNLGLTLAKELLGAALPEDVARSVDEDATAQSLAVWVVRRLFAEPARAPEESGPDKVLFYLRLRERMRDRARYCLAGLTPTVGDWAAVPLPRALSFLHYIIRPLRLMATGIGQQLRRPSAT